MVWRWGPYLSQGDSWHVPFSKVEYLVNFCVVVIVGQRIMRTRNSIGHCGRCFFFLFFQRGGCGFGSLESVVGIATSYELYGPAFESRQGKSFFSAPEPSIPPLLPTQPSIQWIPEVKRPGREGEHSPTILPRLNVSGPLPVLPLYVLMAWTGTVLPFYLYRLWFLMWTVQNFILCVRHFVEADWDGLSTLWSKA